MAVHDGHDLADRLPVDGIMALLSVGPCLHKSALLEAQKVFRCCGLLEMQSRADAGDIFLSPKKKHEDVYADLIRKSSKEPAVGVP